MPLSYLLILALLDDSSSPAKTPSLSCGSPALSLASRSRCPSTDLLELDELVILR
jgi:hypothetical protein